MVNDCQLLMMFSKIFFHLLLLQTVAPVITLEMPD